MSQDIIRNLFEHDVERDIKPVVYFHQQAPEQLDSEVSEYIITGGWPEGHPNHRRVPNGIHEQYVSLLRAIVSELEKPGGPDQPAVWISGFYGSGKSSFAKLLGFALDGVTLPSGKSLAEAWLERDTSPRTDELKQAWAALRQKIDPLAVVFETGGGGRDKEHIHAAVIRHLQPRLGYCSTEPLVADFELKLERDGEWARFEQCAQEALAKPWSEIKDTQLADQKFSRVMSVMFPNLFTDPMTWFRSRAGTHVRLESPEEAVTAIGEMLKFRKPGATLFAVVDEVSQYLLGSPDRVNRLQAFTSALGAGLKGKAWLLALGQQRIEEQAGDSFLHWAKARFKAKLRVHLSATNIRDVVHKRLLEKKPEAQAALKDLFESNRPGLKLYAYACEEVTPDEFAELYPLLPGHIDLLLQITSALRIRSTRAQGDDQNIRGLLQLLGELFRTQALGDKPVGSLITLDQIYEVQQTALESDTQTSMSRVLSSCKGDESGLMVKAAKAVALLELIQDTVPTDAKLVAQSLYDKVGRGNQVPEVTNALEELRRRNLLSYSEKQGYKLQSSAGEEWERERRETTVSPQRISELVSEGLQFLLGSPERPRMQARTFPWAGVFRAGKKGQEEVLANPRDEAVVRVDFRFLPQEDRTESAWVKRSGEDELKNRLVWVNGESEQLEDVARELARSQAMVRRYEPRRQSLPPARRLLLQGEQNKLEDLGDRLKQAISACWMRGKLYVRGRAIDPNEHGASFSGALHVVGNQALPLLFPHFTGEQVQPAELGQLLLPELLGPPQKFMSDGLGILELDSGRYVPACSGIIPQRVMDHIKATNGIDGKDLLAYFGGPPYGYTSGLVKACVVGLLRGGKLRIQPEAGNEITGFRDAGVQDVFTRDRDFARATFSPGEVDDDPRAIAKICKFFEEELSNPMDREPHAIADAVARLFPGQAGRLRDVRTRHGRLPNGNVQPEAFNKLEEAIEKCVRSCRQTKPTVVLVTQFLDVLRDGVRLLKLYDAELTEEVIGQVRQAADVRDHHGAQLADVGLLTGELDAALGRISTHLEHERPWQEIAGLHGDLEQLRDAYKRARHEALEHQENLAEQARTRVKTREGFSTLSDDQAHRVTRPISSALNDTTVDAVAPALKELDDPFLLRLGRGEDEANERLDEILSEGEQPLVQKVDLQLRNRELTTEADVTALVDEIRTKLMEHIIAGTRVRLR
jgi:hypothetical protein